MNNERMSDNPTVKVVKLYFEGNVNNLTKKQLSSGLWKALYNLTEKGETTIDYTQVKKNLQDASLTFSDAVELGDKKYLVYFMSPDPRTRFDMIRAVRNGIYIGRKKLKLFDVEYLTYKLLPDDKYITLSPILVTRGKDYYLPYENDFYKNLLSYLEIKYSKKFNTKIRLKKDNFKVETISTNVVKIPFKNYTTYGVEMQFRLHVHTKYLEIAAKLIQLGLGTKSGLGYGFIIPKRVLQKEQVEYRMKW